MEESTDRVNMGIGKLGESNIVINRKFRWLLWADNLVPYFCKSVDFNYKNKTISFEYIDIVTDKENEDGFIWARKLDEGLLPQERVSFSTLDGCGKETGKVIFKGLKLVSHESSFDYASSEPAAQKIVVSYEEMINVKKSNIERQYWTIEFKELDGTPISSMTIRLSKRPELKIEETELNFLNAKAFVPGKAQWQKLSGEFDQEVANNFWKVFLSRTCPKDKVLATLNSNKGDKVLDSWQLNGVWLQSYFAYPKENKCTFDIRFDSVVYKNSEEKS